MENVIPIAPRPRVLHAGFVRHLAEANRVLRRLRKLGCRVVSQSITEDGAEIVVDRNPHRQVTYNAGVHVTWARGA